jgi:hypothetical protein
MIFNPVTTIVLIIQDECTLTEQGLSAPPIPR